MPGLPFTLYGKIEGLNPGGSAKDRPAAQMLRSAIERGEIGPRTTVVESSSGNMAIGLAQACACLGLRLICVIDQKATAQHRKLLAAYGATIDVVTAPDGDFLAARIARVKALVAQRADVYWPNQYANPENARSHWQTAREIFADTPVDYLFCATSTCGTLRGCSDYLAASDASTQLVAVDAIGSVIFGDTAPAAPHPRPRREPAASPRRRRPRRPRRPRLGSRLRRRLPASRHARRPAGRGIGRRCAERGRADAVRHSARRGVRGHPGRLG